MKFLFGFLILVEIGLLAECYVVEAAIKNKDVVLANRNGSAFALAFLGQTNGKAYWIDTAGAEQVVARYNCQNMGMRLLKIEALDEINWLIGVTGNAENHIWTDAVSNVVPASYEWKSTGARVSDSLSIVPTITFGLRLIKNTYSFGERDRYGVHPYVCYVYLTRGMEPIASHPIHIISEATIGIEERSIPKMTFIGRYGRKSYYVESGNKANQPEARSNCTAMGMKLAVIESQAELEWIVSNAADRPLWTDGVVRAVPSSYRWFSDNSLLITPMNITYTAIGLAIFNRDGLRSVNNESQSVWNYLCYMETA